MTTRTHDGFEDRLLAELRDLVAGRPAPAAPGSERRTNARRALAVACVVAAAAATALLIRGHGPTLARADVLSRAQASLAQPGSVLQLSAVTYGDTRCIGVEAPARCIGSPMSSTTATTTPSPQDASYSFETWSDPASGTQHTLYGTGDETAVLGKQEIAYNPVTNTVTTTEPSGEPQPGATEPAFPNFSGLGVAELEGLYRAAIHGTSTSTRLLGSPHLPGHETYELEIVSHSSTVLLYVDRTTFLPLRAEITTSLSSGRRTTSITDFAPTRLPASPETSRLLRMSPHASVRQRHLTPQALAESVATLTPERAPQPSAAQAAASDPLQ
jgi:hypothetical protein